MIYLGALVDVGQVYIAVCLEEGGVMLPVLPSENRHAHWLFNVHLQQQAVPCCLLPAAAGNGAE
jgi:hypothetical protein